MSNINGFDVAALDTRKGAEDGFELQLISPGNGAPLPIWIKVLGQDSNSYQMAQRANLKRINDKLWRGRRPQLSGEEAADAELDVLVAATAGWRSDALLDGGPWPAFSSSAVKEFYKRFPAFKEQVKDATEDRANFLPKS
jgi:hypothetical protein